MNKQGQENVKRIAVFLMLFLFVGLAACQSPQIACDDPLGCIAVTRGEPIRIGAMAALSGNAKYLGEDSQRAIELAILDRNNTLLGHTIELVVTDSACAAEAGTVAADLVIEDEDVIGVIGPTCSVAAKTAVPIVEAAGLTLISPAATAARLTDPDLSTNGLWQPGFFRTVPSDAYQAQVAAEFAFNQLGATTAAIIYDETAVSNELHQAFAHAFRGLGGQITFQSSIFPGDSNVLEILRGAGAASPDVLYLPVFEPEAILIASHLSDITNLGDVNLLGGTGLFSQDFPVGVGTPVINGMYVLGLALDDAVYERFLERWNGRYSQPPISPYTPHTYDAATLLLDTIEAVAQVDNRDNILIGLQAMREALAATEAYPGITGRLHCGSYGDCAALSSLGIYQINREVIDGKQWPPEMVWQPQ